MPAPLNPAPLHILLALAAEDLHGYGIMQEIDRQSQGTYKVGPGTLYDNLKKLMDQGFVVDAPKKGKGGEEKRRLYHLSTDGRDALKAEIRRLEDVVAHARPHLATSFRICSAVIAAPRLSLSRVRSDDPKEIAPIVL